MSARLDFFSFDIPGIDGSPDLLGPLRGRVILAVNVASRCGYTPQYAGLERLHRELAPQGFAVIGFPSNQFGAQEPGSEQEIRQFCRSSYDVSFPMSAKIEVNGPRRNPLYAWLTSPDAGFPGDIEWNFEKFLVSRDGRVLRRYPPGTRPEDPGLAQDIVDAL